MKRILLIVTLLLVLLGAILYLGSKVRSSVNEGGGTMQTLPDNAIMLLRINSWAELSRTLQSPIGPLAKSIAKSEYRWLATIINRIDSTLHQTSQWSLTSTQGDSYIACYPEGKEEVACLLALPVGDGLSAGKWVGLLFEDATSIRQYEYERTTFVECQFNSFGKPVRGYCAMQNGVALWSSSHILLQQALRRTPQMPSLVREDGFRHVYESADRRKPANLFVRPKGAIPLLAQLLRNEFRKSLLSIKQWAPWIAYDIEDGAAQLALLGESRYSDSLRCVGDLWRGIKPVTVDAIRILPSTTSLFMRWGAANSEQLMILLPNDETGRKANKFAKILSESCSGELTLARILGSANMEPFWAVFIACESPSESLRILDNYSGVENSREIRKFKNPKAFQDLLGKLFPANIATHYVGLDGYIAFSSSEANLRYILNTAQRQQNLARSENWAAMQANIQSRCNFMLYADMHTASRWGRQDVDLTMGKRGMLGQLIGQAGQVALQVSGGNNNLFYNATLQPATERNAKSSVWEVGLKAPLYGRPQLVKSHRAQANLMLVQDQEGGLYLFDGNGSTLWYQQIGETMIGEAIPIDALNNGKLQYAFTTSSKIWVIDYEGNNLPGFPYTLPSAATAPLAVFDYEKNHNYRLLVPCENRTILLIDAKGKRKADFQPKRMETTVTTPAYLFQHAGKDYIVTCDHNRLYILNRKGEERTPMAESVKKHPDSPLIYMGGGSFALLDTKGRICTVSLTDGNVKRTDPLEEWSGHGTILFNPHAAPKEPFCLLLHSDMVRGYTAKGKSLFRYNAPSKLLPWIQTFDFGSKGKLWGICSSAEGKAILLDAKGKIRSEFKASTPFSIGRLDKSDARLKLVAGHRSSIVVFNAQPD